MPTLQELATALRNDFGTDAWEMAIDAMLDNGCPDRLIAAGELAEEAFPGDVYVRGFDLSNDRGYWPKQVALLFARFPSAQIIIVNDEAPTKAGFKISDRPTPILYYRKSSGGRWGRSAQEHYVTTK